MTQKTIKKVGLSIVILIILCFAVCKAKELIEIDKCLDKGGRWNYETEKCELR